MPNVSGVLETSLYVEDLDRSIRFYQSVMRFPKLIADQRFCALSVAERHVLLLFKNGASTEPSVSSGGVIPPHDGDGELHLAFSIESNDWEGWEEWLAEKKVAIESRVRWERGGQSLYFRDPDNHLIELVTPGCWAIY
jgi:catechol 2,3-dioxygenase-like lactoylglutathione lyase family enzyme